MYIYTGKEMPIFDNAVYRTEYVCFTFHPSGGIFIPVYFLSWY